MAMNRFGCMGHVGPDNLPASLCSFSTCMGFWPKPMLVLSSSGRMKGPRSFILQTLYSLPKSKLREPTPTVSAGGHSRSRAVRGDGAHFFSARQ